MGFKESNEGLNHLSGWVIKGDRPKPPTLVSRLESTQRRKTADVQFIV